MALDVWIFGSGFGESILLIWDAIGSGGRTEKRAAMVDCYGAADVQTHPAFAQWLEAGSPPLELLALSHPHVDHIRNADAILLALHDQPPANVVWWGDHQIWRTLGAHLRARKQARGEGRAAAHHTAQFLRILAAALHRKYPLGRTPGPSVRSGFQLNVVYEGKSPDGDVKVHALSPWTAPRSEYLRWQETGQEPRKGMANCTSLGLLIEYGRAQVMLGGDVEAPNWQCFHDTYKDRAGAAHQIARLAPCVVKVSHHGSATSSIPGMWQRGFFGSLDTAPMVHPHCVITPWRRGRRELPDPTVVEMIAGAGCHVWETGYSPEAGPLDRMTRLSGSYIHFTVDGATNQVSDPENKYCKHTTPR